MYTKSFEMIFDSGFSLTEIFQLKLSDGSAFRVVLQEQFLIEALYTDSQFYSKVGQQFCIVFDIVYSKTGTEAAAESLYGVVEKQEMNGGQSISVLGNRARIEWCFPPIVRCERALDEMAKLYVNWVKSVGLKKLPKVKGKVFPAHKTNFTVWSQLYKTLNHFLITN